MVEKFFEKDAKKSHFNNQMEFRKRSNVSLAFDANTYTVIAAWGDLDNQTPYYSVLSTQATSSSAGPSNVTKPEGGSKTARGGSSLTGPRRTNSCR